MDHNASTIIELLRPSYLAEGLSEDDLTAMAEIADCEDVASGATVVRLGDRDADLYVLVRGRVTILGNNREFVVSIRPRSIIGEIALLDARPRSATAVADEDSTLIRIPAAELRHLMDERPLMAGAILRNLGRVLCERLRASNLQMAVLQSIVEG